MMFNFLVFLIISGIKAMAPIGRGAGLDCDIDLLVQEIECSLAQGFNVRQFCCSLKIQVLSS